MNHSVACLTAICFLCTLPLTGCTLAAYGLGVATMVNDMEVRQKEDYSHYRVKVQEKNAVRAKKGLPAEKTMSFRQWSRLQEG